MISWSFLTTFYQSCAIFGRHESNWCKKKVCRSKLPKTPLFAGLMGLPPKNCPPLLGKTGNSRFFGGNPPPLYSMSIFRDFLSFCGKSLILWGNTCFWGSFCSFALLFTSQVLFLAATKVNGAKKKFVAQSFQKSDFLRP